MSTTSTAVITASGSESSTMSMTCDDLRGRVVRFDSECILIPDRELSSRKPKLTKVYSLPLWKKRGHSTSPGPSREVSEVGEVGIVSGNGGTSPTIEERVMFKVPLPRFISLSPSRGRAPSSSPPLKPLSPILVHRLPSSLVSTAPTIPKPLRRVSLPVDYTTHTHKQLSSDEVTIPLRECCIACEAVTDKCILEGEHWHEKFDYKARRRRSQSFDNGSSTTTNKYTFAGVTSDPIPPTSTTAVGGAKFKAPTFALTVDEVDKRRKSLDAVESELIRHSSSSSVGGDSPSPSRTPSPAGPSSLAEGPSLSPSHRPKASPIVEEDEDQLFPLPSPRRSPASTPSVSPRNSPLPSPSASTSCLKLSPYRVSRDSLLRSWTTAEEEVIGASLSRVHGAHHSSIEGGGEVGELRLPAGPTTTPVGTLNGHPGMNKPSGLSLSIPDSVSARKKRQEASTESTASTSSSLSLEKVEVEGLGKAPPLRINTVAAQAGAAKSTTTTSTSSTGTTTKTTKPLPSLSPRSPSFPPASPRSAKSHPISIPTTSSTTSASSTSTPHKKDITSSTSSSTSPTTSRLTSTSPTQSRLTTSLSRSPSNGAGVSRSPSQRRRPSISIPGIGSAIRGAGLEVLRGVTSFGSGGGTMV